MTREVNVDEDAVFEDGRGGFDEGPKKKIPGMRAFVLVMMLLGLAIMGWIIFQNLPGTSGAAGDGSGNSDENMVQNSLPRYNFATTPSNVRLEPETPEPQPQPAPQPDLQPRQLNLSGPTQPKDLGPTPEERALQRRLAGFANSGSMGAAGATRTAASPVGAGGMGGGLLGGGGSEASSALAKRLNATRHDSMTARMLPHPSLTVPMGTMILCGTTTEINTTQPGMVACQVSRDVYSADGKVLLIEKGTHVVGEVGTAMKQGQARVFVLWTRMRTPENVVINLNSPATNRLGSAGIPGQVNTHFWDRFGGAILISVITDASRALIEAAVNSDNSSSGTTINLGTTQSTGNELAREVLRNTLNIPPTLYARQGKVVGIYVARDLDFSSVYDLQYEP